jgi:hypothetical protein
VAALGDDGPDYLIDLYIDELRASLGQIGARTIAEAREASIRHPGAVTFEDTPAVRDAPQAVSARSILPAREALAFPGSPLQGAAFREPVQCRRQPKRSSTSSPMIRSRAQRDRARGRAGACRWQQHGDRVHRQHRRRRARADKGCDPADHGDGFRHVARHLPVGFLARHYGRRFALQCGSAFGILSGFISYRGDERQFLGAAHRHVLRRPLCGGTPSYRFAAADTASDAYRPKVVSWVLAGGVFAAVLGPQLVIFTKDLVSPHLFAAELSGPVGLRDPARGCAAIRQGAAAQPGHYTRRATALEIVRHSRFIVAVACGIASYATMNMVMTSAPLAMVGCGHSITDARSAFNGMYGDVCTELHHGLADCAFRRRAHHGIRPRTDRCDGRGRNFRHLGGAFLDGARASWLGWNLSFIGATTMVTQCHRPHERNKVAGVQRFPDFRNHGAELVLVEQLLEKFGWTSINEVIFPAIFVTAALLLWLSFRRALRRCDQRPHPKA